MAGVTLGSMACPWCQRALRPCELRMRERPRKMGDPAIYYVACEACAWDMDAEALPALRVLH